jgi:anionic cell wall polymer biosynthesis LytR-Cps2A-Psr (LCP) family protein
MTGKRRAGRRGQRPAPGTPPSNPQVIAPRKTRRELRAERRRQRRRRFGAVGIAAIVVGVLIAAAAIGFGVNRATSGSSAPSDPETTLLVSLQGGDGTAVASMLAAHDVKQKQGLELLIPSRLITDVCGFGTQQFGQIVALPQGAQLAQQAVSQLLGGVTVDGSWLLSTQQLSTLVDAVGGVTVDVDVDVERPGPGGTTQVVVPAGKGEHLGGSAAVEFATYQAAGEDATAVLSRFQSVFESVADRLPVKASGAARVLTAAGVKASVPTATLASLLVALARDDEASSLLPEDLPTKTIDTGGGATSYRVDSSGVQSLVQSRLASSLPASAQQKHKTVFIENGVGTSGLVQSACDRLLPAGYGFAGSGNAPNFKYAKSQVIVFDSTVAAAELGDDVARLLRLPQSDVVASTQGQNVADVVVILGGDYKP